MSSFRVRRARVVFSCRASCLPCSCCVFMCHVFMFRVFVYVSCLRIVSRVGSSCRVFGLVVCPCILRGVGRVHGFVFLSCVVSSVVSVLYVLSCISCLVSCPCVALCLCDTGFMLCLCFRIVSSCLASCPGVVSYLSAASSHLHVVLLSSRRVLVSSCPPVLSLCQCLAQHIQTAANTAEEDEDLTDVFKDFRRSWKKADAAI